MQTARIHRWSTDVLHPTRQRKRRAALWLTDQKAHQLPASKHQCMKVLLRLVWHRLDEAVSIRPQIQHLGQLSQHAGIHAVGLD